MPENLPATDKQSKTAEKILDQADAAIALLTSTLANPDADLALRVKAANRLLEKAGFSGYSQKALESGRRKSLSDMSHGELQNFITQAVLVLEKVATPVILIGAPDSLY